MDRFFDQIDWNQVIHIGGLLAGGYVATSVMQWIVPDVIAPLVGIIIAWRVSSSYVRWKKAQVAALKQVVVEKPAPAIYISRARSRISGPGV